MSSIVIEEARIKSHKKGVATSKLAQKRSRVHQVIENEIRRYFLICESCFWYASYYEKLYYDYENSSRSQNIIIKHTRCPACSTDEAVELFPMSFDTSDKPSIGASFK
jgi:hypothetical protein